MYNDLYTPFFIQKNFFLYKIDFIKCQNLYVGCISVKKRSVFYVSVYNTPHYIFARNVLFGESVIPSHGYKDYAHYAAANSHACSVDKFIKLIDSIKTNGYDVQNKPILVFKHWKRPLPFNRWDVADGFHRLAVLAALGEKIVTVGFLHPKNSVLSRLRRRLRV